MVQWLDSMIHTVGPLAFLVLGLAALLEYLVPPFPGDTVVLLGGVYAARGQQPWFWVLAAVMAGSVLGAAANYGIGVWIDRKMERRLEHRTFLGLSLEQLHDVERKMRRRGAWLLLFNRFIPGIRGLFFVAAGMARVPLRKTLVLGAVSALAHSLLILWLGIALGGNAERIEALVNQYQQLALAVVIVVGLVAGARFALRLRRAQER